MSTNSELSSKEQLLSEFFKLVDAGGSVIQIRTREVIRAATILREGILREPDTHAHKEWDIVNGFREFTLENYTHHFRPGDGKGFDEVIMFPMQQLRDNASPIRANEEKVHCFIYLDPHPYIQGNPYIVSLLQQYSALLPSVNVCLVFITPDVSLGDLPLSTVLLLDAPTPSQQELRSTLETLLEGSEGEWDSPHEVEEEDLDRIALLGMGMSRYEFETHASLAMVDGASSGATCITTDMLVEGISKGKTEVVKQSDIIELFPAASMDSVGGMVALKKWLAKRALSFSDEAKEFGIEPPKGIAIVGVPGAGKSQVAKAVAGSWGVPLIRLDFGSVFSKYIGDSESRMRQALEMVGRMGRVVLFADEIDKGLGGIGSGGDSGVSTRVLGTFLTWMQENRSNVFVIMTANRIQGLPPELFRKGRLDEVFSVGLPNREERREVLGVHLRKRNRSIDDFSKAEISRFLQESDKYLPAEIEAAVKDALVLAFHSDEELGMDHLVEALKHMVPMSTSHAAQIDDILEWSRINAVSVSEEEKPVVASVAPGVEPARRTRPVSRIRPASDDK